MDSTERAHVRRLYELMLELWDHQGEEIIALRHQNEALQRSHETIGKMLQVTSELLGREN